MHVQFYQNLSIGPQDIEHKRNFNINQGQYSVGNERKILFNHPNLHLVNINAYTKSDEIHKLIHKILSINRILTSIKSHNSVKSLPKIMCIKHNMELLFITASTKFYQNSSICSEDIEEKLNSVVYKRM